MLIAAVLDTNVLVSGLLNPNGSPGKILDLIVGSHIQVAYDDRILGEYEDVLSRPELHIRPSQAFAVIGHIELSGKYVTVESLSTEGYPDPDDICGGAHYVQCRRTGDWQPAALQSSRPEEDACVFPCSVSRKILSCTGMNRVAFGRPQEQHSICISY